MVHASEHALNGAHTSPVDGDVAVGHWVQGLCTCLDVDTFVEVDVAL